MRIISPCGNCTALKLLAAKPSGTLAPVPAAPMESVRGRSGPFGSLAFNTRTRRGRGAATGNALVMADAAKAADAAEEDAGGEEGAVADSGTGADEDDGWDDTKEEDEEDSDDEEDEDKDDDADEETGALPWGPCDAFLPDAIESKMRSPLRWEERSPPQDRLHQPQNDGDTAILINSTDKRKCVAESAHIRPFCIVHSCHRAPLKGPRAPDSKAPENSQERSWPHKPGR